MSEFPSGWATKTIEETCDIHDSRRIPLSSEQRRDRKGRYPYYGANNIQDYIDDFIFDFDAVLLAEDGGYYEEYESRDIAQYATNKYWVNNHAHILTGKSGMDTKFLYYSLVRKNICQWINTGTRSKLNQADLKQIELLVPPLPEQKKIAEILSGIDRVINARRNSAEAIAQIGNFTAEELFQRASIACNSVKIGDCTRRLWQGINTAADKVEYHDTGVPILQAKHVTSGRIDPQGSRYLSEEDYNKYKERYQPHAGDILFTNIGTIGKSALVTDRPKFLIAWNIFLISPSEEIISEYLQYFLQSLDRRNYFHEHAAGNATKFINKTLISELEVPLPPKEQQIKVCNQIRAINKAEECDRNAIAKYLELKRSLLIDLLSGRKRVSI
jgi:type I restriction enzyme S subunit